MDRVMDSGSIDAGSIPVRDARKTYLSAKGKVCLFCSAPGKGNNLGVEVSYALGSRKR